MRPFLPGSDTIQFGDYSKALIAFYATEHYILLGLYLFGIVLVTLNAWNILIKQGRYRTLPLLAFYIFAFLSLAIRTVYLILVLIDDVNLTESLINFYVATKLSVGIIQSQMILEIALRIRKTDFGANGAEKFER